MTRLGEAETEMVKINKLVVKLQGSFGSRVSGTTQETERWEEYDKRRGRKNKRKSNEPEIFSREIALNL